MPWELRERERVETSASVYLLRRAVLFNNRKTDFLNFSLGFWMSGVVNLDCIHRDLTSRKRNTHSKEMGCYSHSQYESACDPNMLCAKHLSSIRCLLIALLVFVVLGVAMFCGLLIGLGASGAQLTATSDATVAMHQKMVETEDQVRTMIERYASHMPPNQLKVTIDQVLDIVSKADTIAGQAVVLLGAGEQLVDRVKDDDLIEKANGIVTSVETLTETLAEVAEAFEAFRGGPPQSNGRRSQGARSGVLHAKLN